MGSTRISPRLSRISLFLLYTTVQATALFPRQEAVCGGIDNLAQCGSDFPSEFCCPKDSTCMRLNSLEAVSVICCPAGLDCTYIQPITCDITQFDPKRHPDNQIHLSTPNGIELPKCGDKCCPVGYSCSGNMCKADPITSTPPTPSPTLLPTPSSTPSPTRAPTNSQTTEAAAAEPIIRTEQGFDGKSFVAGFFPGVVLGALGALGLVWVIKKRREAQEKDRYSGDFGHVSHTISDPIYDPAYAARTDFIRRDSQSAQHSPNSLSGMIRKESMMQSQGGMTPKIKSLWERTLTPKLGFNGFGGTLPANPAPVPPAIRAGQGRDPYKTPTRTPNSFARTNSITRTPSIHIQKTLQRPITQRGNSAETIDVVMRTPDFLQPPKAPGMRENRLTTDSGQTTFTKLMERAGYDRNSREEVRGWKGSPR